MVEKSFKEKDFELIMTRNLDNTFNVLKLTGSDDSMISSWLINPDAEDIYNYHLDVYKGKTGFVSE